MDETPYLVPADDAPGAPRGFYNKLVRLAEFEHLREGEPAVDFLLCAQPVMRQGKQVLGACHLPQVQGRLRGVFTWLLACRYGRLPDFLVTLDLAFWSQASASEREILVYHEMKHMIHQSDREGELRFDEEGHPVWGLVAHDVEEFIDTVRRYGAYSPEISGFLKAARKKGQA